MRNNAKRNKGDRRQGRATQKWVIKSSGHRVNVWGGWFRGSEVGRWGGVAVAVVMVRFLCAPRRQRAPAPPCKAELRGNRRSGRELTMKYLPGVGAGDPLAEACCNCRVNAELRRLVWLAGFCLKLVVLQCRPRHRVHRRRGEPTRKAGWVFWGGRRSQFRF